MTYELTALGHSLLDLLDTVYAWSDEHGEDLLDAYDPDDAEGPTPRSVKG